MDSVTLVIQFLGMKPVEVIVTDFKKEVNVRLEEEQTEMDEVVVTGYGNFRKGNYTGAATTVKAADIIIAGATSIDQMLQGVVPGMLVRNQSGQVGLPLKSGYEVLLPCWEAKNPCG